MKQYSTDLDALLGTIDFKGKNVVDIGCGDGGKAKELVKQGANVIGIEPNLESWKLNEFKAPGFKILNGGAEKLDIEDNWADIIISMYSLHHVPTESMQGAILEACRVLKNAGTLYIAEPIAEGSYQDVCEPFLDETLIRAQAKKAVETAAIPSFKYCHEFDYQVSEYFTSFSEFVDEMMRYSLNRYEFEDVGSQQVKAQFEQTQIVDGYRLDQPVKCWVLYNCDQNLIGDALCNHL